MTERGPMPTTAQRQALLHLRSLSVLIGTVAQYMRSLGYEQTAEHLEHYVDEKHVDYYDPYEWKPVAAMIKDLEAGVEEWDE